jgi:hypothetical protein
VADRTVVDYHLSHVLTVASLEPEALRLGSHFSYLHVPLPDFDEIFDNADVLLSLVRCTDWIHQAVTAGGRVLVHCRLGVNRGPAVVVAYLIRFHGLSLMAAADTVNGQKTIELSDYFFTQLAIWESSVALLGLVNDNNNNDNDNSNNCQIPPPLSFEAILQNQKEHFATQDRKKSQEKAEKVSTKDDIVLKETARRSVENCSVQ